MLQPVFAVDGSVTVLSNRRMNYRTLFAMLILAGCSSSSSTTTAAKGDYKLSLTGYAPHASEPVFLKIKNAAGTTTIASTMGTIDAQGLATLSIPAVLEDGTAYRVDFYCDHTPADGSSAYVPPTAGTPPTFNDHSWRRMVVGKSAAPGVVESFAHDANWTDISPF